jgi:DNA-binding response OmpR family regulator
MNYSSQPHQTYLIVSSDPSLLELLSESIELDHGNAIAVSSMKDALFAIETHEKENHSFNAVVSDFNLVDGSGLDLIRRLKRCGITTPTGLMIGRDPNFTELAALAEGADLVFQKPFGVEDFLDGLRALSPPPSIEPQASTSLNGQIGWF